MAKQTLEQLRERAITDLIVLFGIKKDQITESLIMFMIGLYNSGADVVGIALNRMNVNEWERMHPSTPQGDEEWLDESEETKAIKRWNKNNE